MRALALSSPAALPSALLMARVTPDEAAEKWAQRTGAATEDYRRGVERVQTAPGLLAARQAQKYLMKVQASVPKFQENVAAVSLDEWQAATIEKGTQRLAGGVQAARGKMADFMAELLPHVDRGKAQLASMPSTTIEDSQARAAFWIRHMAAFGRGRGGGR